MPSKESGVLRPEQMENVANLFSSCVLMCQMGCYKHLVCYNGTKESPTSAEGNSITGKEIAGLQGNEHRVFFLAISSEEPCLSQCRGFSFSLFELDRKELVVRVIMYNSIDCPLESRSAPGFGRPDNTLLHQLYYCLLNIKLAILNHSMRTHKRSFESSGAFSRF
jgi:hypothetical protein